MYVIGKDTLTDKGRRSVESMSLKEQLDHYLRSKSWVAYFATCWKMGLLTDSECARLKTAAMKGQIK